MAVIPHAPLQGQRILLTQAGDFMGPALHAVLAEQGALVLASDEPLDEPGAAGRIAAEHVEVRAIHFR